MKSHSNRTSVDKCDVEQCVCQRHRSSLSNARTMKPVAFRSSAWTHTNRIHIEDYSSERACSHTHTIVPNEWEQQRRRRNIIRIHQLIRAEPNGMNMIFNIYLFLLPHIKCTVKHSRSFHFRRKNAIYSNRQLCHLNLHTIKRLHRQFRRVGQLTMDFGRDGNNNYIRSPEKPLEDYRGLSAFVIRSPSHHSHFSLDLHLRWNEVLIFVFALEPVTRQHSHF